MRLETQGVIRVDRLGKAKDTEGGDAEARRGVVCVRVGGAG